MAEKKNLAVFVSGSGSNMMAILDAIEAGQVKANLCLVVSNTPLAGALEKAASRNIATRVLSQNSFGNAEEYVSELLAVLSENKIDTLVLAGFLRKIPEALVKAFEHKILNIHPSLLPAFGGKGFYGKKVHEAVIQRGVKWTGVTVHYVTPIYDEGPIILQELVEVLPGDTPDSLAQRVLLIEHKLFPKALALHVDDQLEIREGLVTIKS